MRESSLPENKKSEAPRLHSFHFHPNKNKYLVSSNVDSFLPTIVFGQVKSNLIIFTDIVHQSAYVNEYVLLAFIIQDESKTFSLIEKFNFTC